jgi:hypothetical protein
MYCIICKELYHQNQIELGVSEFTGICKYDYSTIKRRDENNYSEQWPDLSTFLGTEYGNEVKYLDSVKDRGINIIYYLTIPKIFYDDINPNIWHYYKIISKRETQTFVKLVVCKILL